MTFKTNIEEIAISTAKRYDHAEITAIHILYALKKNLNDDLPGIQFDSIEKILSKINTVQSNQISISDEAHKLLDKLNNAEDARGVATHLSNELLDSIDVEEIQNSVKQDENLTKIVGAEKANLEESLAKLNSLIGLQEVKQQVQNLINVHQANNLRHSQGMSKIPVGMHCVFTGSPGTGKTTIARAVAEMYFAIGLLPSNKVIEVDRSKLVAGYVGQTALKVQEVIEEAKGGVLFIDEAYALSSDSGAGFGDEAIATLVKAMEDNRENMAVIVAGYKDPMKAFIDSNQGLNSRFQNFIHFSDYSITELTQIFHALCDAHQISANEDVKSALNTFFAESRLTSEDGNARFVRNLFERMYLNLSNRAAADGHIEIHELTEFDVSDIPKVEKRKHTLGFLTENP